LEYLIANEYVHRDVAARNCLSESSQLIATHIAMRDKTIFNTAIQYNAIQLITDIAYLICDCMGLRKPVLSTSKLWPHFQCLKFNNFFPKNDVHLNFLPLMHQSLEDLLKLTELL